jgi:cell division protein FtsB
MIKIIIKNQIKKTGMFQALKDENERLRHRISGLEDERDNLMNDKIELRYQVNTLLNSRWTMQSEIINLKKRHNVLENRIDLLKDNIEERRKWINGLKDKIYTLNNLKDNLNNEIQSLKRVFIWDNIEPSDDYSNLTIIIPYRKTNDEGREGNLDINLRYLSKIGISNLIISEYSDVSTKDHLMAEYAHLFKSFIVIWNDSKGNLFNKAYAVNKGVLEIKTPYFGMFDSDSLTKKKNIGMAIALLDHGFDKVHPFNRRVTDIVEKEDFREEYDFNTVTSPEQNRPWADGGIIFWKKSSFILMGMENEYFVGWGGEDNEITIRSNMLQINQYRIDDTLYHLHHHKFMERTQNNWDQLEKTKQFMNKESCIQEINKWPWVIDAKNKYFMRIEG